MVHETNIVGRVNGQQVVQTIFHRMPAKSLARWSIIPPYDGKVLRLAHNYESHGRLDGYIYALQGNIDLLDLGLIPAQRPESLFPSHPDPDTGAPSVRIPHASWWYTPNGSLLVWFDCYPYEMDAVLAHLKAAGWVTEMLPLGLAHHNPPHCIPFIGCSGAACAAWFKAILEATIED